MPPLFRILNPMTKIRNSYVAFSRYYSYVFLLLLFWSLNLTNRHRLSVLHASTITYLETATHNHNSNTQNTVQRIHTKTQWWRHSWDTTAIGLSSHHLLKHAPTWHNLRSPPLSPPQKHHHLHSPFKRLRFAAHFNHHQQLLNLRPRPGLPRLPPPPHDRGAQPGPPQQGLRGGRVSEAGPG